MRVLDFVMRPSLYAHFTISKGASLCVSTLDFLKLLLSICVYYSLKAVPLPSFIFSLLYVFIEGITRGNNIDTYKYISPQAVL